MPPPPANKSMGRRCGKDGRPTVSDLIQAREAEAVSRDAEVALRKELAEKRQRHEDFRWEESCRTSRIIAGEEIEYLLQVQQLQGLSSSDHDSNHPPVLLEKPVESTMTFFDLRSDSSGQASTPDMKSSGETVPLEYETLPKYDRAYQIQDDSQTRLEVRPSIFIQ